MPSNIRVEETQSFQAVARGATANVPLTSKGPSYAGLILNYQRDGADASDAQIASDIEEVKVRVNSKSLIELTGKELLDVGNDYYGYERQAGRFFINFARPEFDNGLAEDQFRLGTLDVETLSIEVQLAAAGTHVPSLKAHSMIYRDRVNEPMGNVIRMASTSVGSTISAGVREITELPIRGSGQFLKAMHVTSDAVDSHEIKIRSTVGRDDFHDMDNLTNLMVNDLKSFKSGGRVPQTGYYHIDVSGNRSEGSLSTDLTEFRLKLAMNAATPDLKIITEEIVSSL